MDSLLLRTCLRFGLWRNKRRRSRGMCWPARPREFVHAAIGRHDQSVRFHNNCAGVQERAFRSGDEIIAEIVAVLVEMRERPADSRPDILGHRIDAHRGDGRFVLRGVNDWVEVPFHRAGQVVYAFAVAAMPAEMRIPWSAREAVRVRYATGSGCRGREARLASLRERSVSELTKSSEPWKEPLAHAQSAKRSTQAAHPSHAASG